MSVKEAPRNTSREVAQAMKSALEDANCIARLRFRMSEGAALLTRMQVVAIRRLRSLADSACGGQSLAALMQFAEKCDSLSQRIMAFGMKLSLANFYADPISGVQAVELEKEDLELLRELIQLMDQLPTQPVLLSLLRSGEPPYADQWYSIAAALREFYIVEPK